LVECAILIDFSLGMIDSVNVAPPPSSSGGCLPDIEMPSCEGCVDPNSSASVGCGGGGGPGAPRGHGGHRMAIGPAFVFLAALALRRRRR
jgi:hypothetical protein